MKTAVRILYRGVNAALGLLEGTVLSRGRESALLWPPVFILGAPRSGSTLLYQVLTEAFDFAYLTNLQGFLAGAACSLALRPDLA